MGSLDGRCMCGSASYSCDAEPMMTLLCHCRDCQRQSGAPASIVVIVDRSAFVLDGETLACHETVNGEHGARRERWFCSRCGSPLVTYMDDMPQFAVIKAGTLDDTSQLKPTGEIWRESAQAWWPQDPGRGQFPRGLAST
jgi:hypothetical protein